MSGERYDVHDIRRRTSPFNIGSIVHLTREDLKAAGGDELVGRYGCGILDFRE